MNDAFDVYRWKYQRIEGLPVQAGDDGSHKTDASVFLRIPSLTWTSLLFGLSQPLHPQQLPFGRVVLPTHGGFIHWTPTTWGAEGLGGRGRRPLGGAGRHAPRVVQAVPRDRVAMARRSGRMKSRMMRASVSQG